MRVGILEVDKFLLYFLGEACSDNLRAGLGGVSSSVKSGVAERDSEGVLDLEVSHEDIDLFLTCLVLGVAGEQSLEDVVDL